MVLDDMHFEIVMLGKFFFAYWANYFLIILPYVLDADAATLPMYPL